MQNAQKPTSAAGHGRHKQKATANSAALEHFRIWRNTFLVLTFSRKVSVVYEFTNEFAHLNYFILYN